MGRRRESTEGLVLSRDDSGESYLRHRVLSPRHGLMLCLQRRPKPGRAPGSARPDIFDHAALDLEQGSGDGAWFILAFRPLRRHAGIARCYEALRYASAFARVLAENLDHAESPRPLFDLALTALDGWDRRSRPEVVFLKALFVLARDEGYAVKEQWWRSLPPGDRAAVSRLLAAPADEPGQDREAVERHIASIRAWMVAHTDIRIRA